MALKTNYLDFISSTANRFAKVSLEDDTVVHAKVKLEDITTYTQTGDTFGASDLNETNTQVNTNETNITTNASAISDNADDISTNTGNISTNSIALGGYSLWSGTQTEYDALTPDDNTLYFIEE